MGKLKRPKALWPGIVQIDRTNDGFPWPILIKNGLAMRPREARKLAAWLVRAADYLESRKK